MLDVKVWLETTGLKVAEERFLIAPALPYIVFTETVEYGGADCCNNIAIRRVSIELYAEKIHKAAEAMVEALLTSNAFTKDRTWIESENLMQTVYNLEFVERT